MTGGVSVRDVDVSFLVFQSFFAADGVECTALNYMAGRCS